MASHRFDSRFFVLLSLALLLLASTAVRAEQTAQFERKMALAVSQAAIGRTLDDYTLTLSDGTEVSLADYRGKPLVISLVFTSCFHICPATTQQLQRGVRHARQALGNDSFNVLTIGFDVANDTPQAMASYRKKQSISDVNWDFAAADKATINALTDALGFQFYPSPNGFDHLVQSTVIDEQGKVYRQVYGVRFPIPHLVEPLKELVFGTKPDDGALEALGNRILLFCTVYDPASDSYRFDYSIFVGLFVGLSLGAAFLYIIGREWVYALRQGREQAMDDDEAPR